MPQELPEQPCHNCHGTEFWSRGWGWICNRCHPCIKGVDKEICRVEDAGIRLPAEEELKNTVEREV